MEPKVFTSKELAEKLGVSLNTWKRWAREFLGEDPSAGLHGGRARKFNAEEAFFIFLAGQLVQGYSFSIHEARTIISDIKPWLKKREILPFGKGHFNITTDVGEFIDFWELDITRSEKPEGYFNYAAMLILESFEEKDEYEIIWISKYILDTFNSMDANENITKYIQPKWSNSTIKGVSVELIKERFEYSIDLQLHNKVKEENIRYFTEINYIDRPF